MTAIQAVSGLTIDPGKTLIIFDEIQALPEAITALKYFQEDAPGYHIIAAGSLLGMALHSNISFPVGKVNFMDMYPMTFLEFLVATGEKSLSEILLSQDWKLITSFKSGFINHLRQYYYVGGMPESVQKFSENNNFADVRIIQKEILNTYELDFSKHAPSDIVPRVRMLWNSVPSQLAKENRKFIYGLVKKGSRAKDYESSLLWLTDCGQVHKVYRANKPSIPLKAYEERETFKLFLADVGLLSAMGEIDPGTLIDGNRIFTEFKGALTEQYVHQQLNSSDKYVIYYWSAEGATSEIDFLLQYDGRVVPVEVKAEENLQAKSLKFFCQKYNPPIAVRTSMSDFRKESWLINIPLYAVGLLKEITAGEKL